MKLIRILLAVLITPSLLLAQDIPDFGDAQTVITSDQLEMENKESSNHFYFKGNVIVLGNNLKSTCDEMEVITRQSGQKSQQTKRAAHAPADSELGAIEKIIAIGSVTITQTGRTATADRAEIYPDKDYVELIGNVELENEHGTVSGPRFILEKGKRARMISDGGSLRPTVTLPSLPDLGVNEEDLLKRKQEDKEATASPKDED